MLRDILKDHKGWITFTYILTVLEFAIFALLPYLLGKAVDALLAKDSDSFVFYIGCCVTGLFLGFFRRRMDTRVFMSIWKIRAVSTIESLIDRGVQTPKLFSRSQLVKRYPDFFEFTLPMTVSSVMEIFIAGLMICLVVPLTGLLVSGLCILAIGSSYAFSRLIRCVEDRMQHIREERDNSIAQRDMNGVEEQYEGLKTAWVTRSDLDAYCWGVSDLLGVVAEVILIVAIVNENVTAGTILASVTYCGKMFIRSGFLAYFFNHLQELDVATEFLNAD
jgi:ABC-type multidrug transport system fused ATPase/permease subunit